MQKTQLVCWILLACCALHGCGDSGANIRHRSWALAVNPKDVSYVELKGMLLSNDAPPGSTNAVGDAQRVTDPKGIRLWIDALRSSRHNPKAYSLSDVEGDVTAGFDTVTFVMKPGSTLKGESFYIDGNHLRPMYGPDVERAFNTYRKRLYVP